MKDFFTKYHEKIDYMSVNLFLYSVLVLICIKLFSFINTEIIYVSLVLLCPLFACNKFCVNWFNNLLHRIFRFRR